VIKDFLRKIIRSKIRELKTRKKQFPLKSFKKLQDREKRDFRLALSREGLNIIAEVKKASPSKGVIRRNFNPLEIARSYDKNGAAAISVLTETEFFQGRLEYLSEISKNVSIPVLRKDFIIDPYQIYESAFFGADAILLIIALLNKPKLRKFLKLAESLGLYCLVEVHNRNELSIALECGADIIGINNRDLRTFKVDIKTTFDLMSLIPASQNIIVSESGIRTPSDARRLQAGGVNAILIGETLMHARNIAGKLREFRL
jgi:indole-3-glycerol phosphate synthase